MVERLDRYVVVLLTGLGVAYVLTPWVRALAHRVGAVDQPGGRRMHERATARGGGLAVVLAFHVACLVAFLGPWEVRSGAFDFSWWTRMAGASAVLLLVGLWDDVRGMKPSIKLAGQVLAASLVAWSGTRVGALFGWEIPGWLGATLVVVWLVAMINAFNLIDGLDGLASGLAIVSSLGLAGMFVLQGSPGSAIVLMALVGACLGFLRYNFHPASIFLGDTGSMFLGFTLGLVSLETLNKGTLLLALSIPMFVLGVPVYDTLLAIWRRSMRMWMAHRRGVAGDGQARIMGADVEHLHHRLLRRGWSTQKVAGTLWTINLALVCVGFLLIGFSSHANGIFLIALLALAYLLFRHLAMVELKETGQAVLTGIRRPSRSVLKLFFYPFWDVAWLSSGLALSYWLLSDGASKGTEEKVREVIVWVLPTFNMLVGLRLYSVVWSRVDTRDVLKLAMALLGGMLLSLAIALLVKPGEGTSCLLRGLLVGAVALPPMLGLRLVTQMAREFMDWMKGVESDPNRERILVYGAGQRCALFLQARLSGVGNADDARTIVGLVDDDPGLKGRWVYGHWVLGTGQELPGMIVSYRITAVVVAAGLRPESMALLAQASSQAGIKVSEWNCGERPAMPGLMRAEPGRVTEVPTPSQMGMEMHPQMKAD